MRAFIAIELPREIKDSLAKLQWQLKSSGADVKWVEPSNIHLTMKFLGEIDDKIQDKVGRALEESAKDKTAFNMRLAALGAFPKLKSPRVIWVGIDQGDNEAKAIAKELEQNLEKIGIPKEDRPFSSHITIGRTRSPQNREKLVENLTALADKFGQENLEFKVTGITLFKSTLTPGGPIYQALKETPLKTT